MRFFLLTILLFLKSINSLPEDLIITSPDISPSTNPIDPASLNDIASAETSPEANEQSNPITSPKTDSPETPIAISTPNDSKNGDPNLLANTGSVDSMDDETGLLMAQYKKEDIVTPNHVDKGGPSMPTCPVQKIFHCCYIKNRTFYCLPIKSSDQACNGSGFHKCCAGTRPNTPPRPNSPYGIGIGCESIMYTPRPSWGEQIMDSIRHNAQKAGDGWQRYGKSWEEELGGQR